MLAALVVVTFSAALFVSLYATYRKAPPVPHPIELYPRETQQDLVEVKLNLEEQVTVLTDRRLIQSQKQMPFSFWLCWFLFWRAWQDKAKFMDLRQLDSASFRRGPNVAMLFVAFVLSMIVVDLGLFMLISVLTTRLIYLDFRSPTERITVTAPVERAGQLASFLARVQAAASADKASEMLTPAADQDGVAEAGQFRLARAEVSAIALGIALPAIGRLLGASVSVDNPWVAGPLMAIPLFVGARRGKAAGAVAGLFCAGGLVGAVAPLLPASHVGNGIEPTMWLAVFTGLPVAGVLAAAWTERHPTFAALALVGYLAVYQPRTDLLQSEAAWSCMLIGCGLGLLAVWLAPRMPTELPRRRRPPPAPAAGMPAPPPL